MLNRLRAVASWLALLFLAAVLTVFAYGYGISNLLSQTPVKHQSPANNPSEAVVKKAAKEPSTDKTEATTELVAEPSQSNKILLEPFSPNLPTCLASMAMQQSDFSPPQETASAHSTNFGHRYRTDINGNPATNELLVVLHETVASADSAINTFQTPHYLDSKQVSYHNLIRLDGTIVNIVPLQMRAFGAGNSVFEGPNGAETVQTNPSRPPSVNNFAYHISLESPADSPWKALSHEGYTEAQYYSLAWLIARTCTPDSRVTTHKEVDHSGSRRDPRSFDRQKLLDWLSQFPERVALR